MRTLSTSFFVYPEMTSCESAHSKRPSSHTKPAAMVTLFPLGSRLALGGTNGLGRGNGSGFSINMLRLPLCKSKLTHYRLPFRLGEICRIPVKSRFRRQPWKDLRVMARVCDICGKGPQFGNTISHAHNVSKRRWNVNLRPVHAKVGAATKHIRVCTSCLRSGKVVKA